MLFIINDRCGKNDVYFGVCVSVCGKKINQLILIWTEVARNPIEGKQDCILVLTEIEVILSEKAKNSIWWGKTS